MFEILFTLGVIVGLGFLFGGRKGAQIAVGITVGLLLVGVISFVLYANHVNAESEEHARQGEQLCKSKGGNWRHQAGDNVLPDADGCFYPSRTATADPFSSIAKIAPKSPKSPKPQSYGNATVDGSLLPYLPSVYFYPNNSDWTFCHGDDVNAVHSRVKIVVEAATVSSPGPSYLNDETHDTIVETKDGRRWCLYAAMMTKDREQLR